MKNKEIQGALAKCKMFKMENSCIVAAQIPDKTVGISGSRCSNCNSEAGYCEQVCGNCKLPFIGPFGFPDLSEWENLDLEQKKEVAMRVFYQPASGRLGYVNVNFFPLTPQDLQKIEKLSNQESVIFHRVHTVEVNKIRDIYFT